MSYTIHTVVKSEKWHKAMLLFLEEQFRPNLWPDAAHIPHDHRGHPRDPMPPPMTAKQLGARNIPALSLGFHYNAGWESEERHYAFGLVRWIALRVGPRSKKNHACYFYEGDRVAVVLASEHPDHPDGWSQGWDVVDDVGFVPCHRLTPEDLAEMEAEAHGDDKERAERAAYRLRGARGDPALRAELQRLDALWRTRFPDGK